MFHSPLFLHLSIRYMLIFWNSRLYSHYFYAQPAEPHCSVSSISIVMKVKNLQGSLNSWLWHCQCQNTGSMKHIHTAKASSSQWCWLLSFRLLHFITVFYYFFSMFTKARSWELQKNVTFGINTRMSDTICFWSRILLYLNRWNINKCTASDDLFINLFLVYYFL